MSTGGVRTPTLRLRSRWARRLGALWLTAAGTWALADVLLLASGGGLQWDALAVPVLTVVGLATRRAALDVDGEGFVVHEGLRSHRVLWASVERVEVDWSRRLDAPVRVHLRRDARPLSLHATWRLPPEERDRLLAVLDEAAAAHDLTVDRA